MAPARSRLWPPVLELVVVASIATVAVAWAALAGAPTARAIRRGFDVLEPVLVLEIAAVLAVGGAAGILIRGARPGLLDADLGSRARRLAEHGRRMPTSVFLAVVVASAALFRVVLVAANHYPKVLGDELVYGGLAKGWAFEGRPKLRGASDVGHSTLYPLLIAPLFRLASDGAGALAAARVMDALLMAFTAVPAYILARRVTSRGWALGVAALSAFAPWTAYAALTMTESLFYPAFVSFAAILVWTLERPTLGRQAAMLGTLVVLVGIRAQAIAIVVGVVGAILLQGLVAGTTAPTARRFLPTFAVLVAGFSLGVVAALVGVDIPTSSYNSLYDSLHRLGGMAEWGVWSAASFALALGVVTFAALPVAIAVMLRRAQPAPVRATAVATTTLGLGLLCSVALLSASPYGLDTLHERNLFYVTPLVLTCVFHWLANGLERPRPVAAVAAIATFALVVVLPASVVLESNDVDAPSSAFLAALVDQLPGTRLRMWIVLLGLLGVVAFLLVRRAVFVVLSIVLAFAAVVAHADYRDGLTGAQARAIAWVDPLLPDGATATLVYLGVPYSSEACAAGAAAAQQDLTIWTEAFSTRVRLVRNVYQPNPRDGLASPALTVGEGGVILDGERPYSPEYVVIDTRQPLVGTRIGRFDLDSIGSNLGNGASLTLWRVDPPLRFYPRANPLPPRGNGTGC